jgi:antitoxin component of MazEF toxin-antitoxin module
MVRKIFKAGHSLVITLPKGALERLDLHEGSTVTVSIDSTGGRLIIETAQLSTPGVDATFATQLDAFIERYRYALETLAK